MKKYNITIKFIAPYFQARFSERAQNALKVKSGTKSKVDDSEMWKDFLYKDKKGIYIPSMQFKMSLVNGGKSVKKKPYGSFKDIIKAYLFVEPDKIYIDKQEPDYINESYPSRKDGLRVKVLHPAFNIGLEVNWILSCLSDDIDDSTIKLILEKAGLENGVGAWRPEHGRYIIEKFEKL